MHERSGRKDQRTVRLLCQMAWHGLDRSTSLMEEHGIQALLLARTLHDKAGEGLALSCLAQLELIRARSGTLQALALEASNLLAQHGSGFERIFGDFTLSSLDDLAGRYVDCVQHADEAVAISDSLKYTEMTVQALVNSAMAYSRLGVDSVVRDRLDRVRSLLPLTRSAEAHAFAMFFLSANEQDTAKRRKYLDRCQSILHTFDLRQIQAGLYLMQGEQYLQSGRIADASACFERGLQCAEQTNATVQVMFASAGIGLCDLQFRHYEKARHSIARALAIAEQAGHKNLRLHLSLQMAECIKATGAVADAVPYLDTAIRLLNEIRDPGAAARLAGYQLAELDARRTAVIASLDRQRGEQELFRNIMTGGVAMVLMAGSWLFVVYRKNKRISQQLEHALDRSDALLLNVLPASIAQRLRSGEAQIVDHFDDVSILFLDIAGFSQLAGTMSAEELLMMLNRIFTICDDVVQRHGLEKIKTIGDAYMAVCGAPLPVADHARRTGLAAIDIMLALEKDREMSSASGRPTVHVRIGLHTGPAIGGIIGEQKFSYDLWGEAVNIAARMEQLGEVDRIHVTSAFSASTDLAVAERGPVHVKGYGTMTTWWLTWQ